MRFLFFLLLAANVALFLYARDTPPPPELPPPLSPEKIRLIRPLADGEPVPQAPAPTGAPAATAAACLEWGPIAEAQADNARAALNRLPSIQTYQEIHRVAPPRSWLVSLGGFGSRSAAANRANELRRQNINDISVIETLPTFALSLGVFSSEQAAQSRAAALAARDIGDIVVTPRTVNTVFFSIPSPSPLLAQAIRDLAPRFADSGVQEAPCTPAAP